MANKSPTFAVKYGETIGTDEFSQRREVFDKHGTIFLPPQSPTMGPAHEVEPIITSNHGKTTANFKRNTPAYSSMRETKTADKTVFDFRPRKFSDNFTSELNQSDDVDYRHTMTERTRRLSKLRRDFLNSNLHDPSESSFTRVGTRASLPARSASITYSPYKLESPNLYKFPFAEPYTTPTPARKVLVDLGPLEIDNMADNQGPGKENEDPELRQKYQSLPNDENTSKIDHQKLFEQLVKRYSPQRKPIDWTLPPTKPRVVGSVPKSTSSGTGTITDKSNSQESLHKSRDEVFNSNNDSNSDNTRESGIILQKESVNSDTNEIEVEEQARQKSQIQNGPTPQEYKSPEQNKERDSKISLTELAEKNDQVPELSTIQRQISKESSPRKTTPDVAADLSIPALIEKMTTEGETLETKKKEKKVKRKRSFLDKILGRKKEK